MYQSLKHGCTPTPNPIDDMMSPSQMPSDMNAIAWTCRVTRRSATHWHAHERHHGGVHAAVDGCHHSGRVGVGPAALWRQVSVAYWTAFKPVRLIVLHFVPCACQDSSEQPLVKVSGLIG